MALKLEPTVPAWLRAIHATAMPLGLDLQGGVHFLMAVDQNSVIDKQEDRYADDIRSLLREKNIRYESVARNRRGQRHFGDPALGGRTVPRPPTPSPTNTPT